jgi:hypothetical protein
LSAPACGERQELADDDSVWRRQQDHIDYLEWSYDDDKWLPTAKALQFNPDLSTYWRQHLERVHKNEPESIFVEGDHRYTLVYECGVVEIRTLGFGVEHSPEGSTEPPECAHTSVNWPNGNMDKQRRRELRSPLARALQLVYGTISLTTPPDA